MLRKAATLCLGPILLRQGRQVRRETIRLPEPDGERQGTVGQGSPLRVLIIGDSAAAGVGAQSQAEALSGQLVAALAADHRVSWQLYARSGATAGQMLRRLPRLDDGQLDWVVVSLGVNDAVARTRPAAWLETLTAIRTLLRAKFDAPRILFSGLPPMHLFPALPQPLRWYLGSRARELDRALAQWAAGHPDCARLDTGFSQDPALMASDGFHPGPVLYQLWGRELAGHILAHEDAPVAGGWCPACQTRHRLDQGPARTEAHRLMAELSDRKRIDIGTGPGDSRFSTDYLFGPARGQMFGVLVAEDVAGSPVVLRAFSGQYDGVWEVPGWAPPLFSVADYERIMEPGDRQLKELGRQLVAASADENEARRLARERKELSRNLMAELHALYEVRNFHGETRSLVPFYTHAKGAPTGAGDCCAPKLLNQAARLNLRPLGLAEFYWGAPNRSGTREHGRFYGSCNDKCEPLLGYMLCGLSK